MMRGMCAMVAVSAGVVAVSTFGAAAAPSLGVASDFNVFVLGDHTAQNTDVWGRVAVGGSANYMNYTVGAPQTQTLTPSGGARDDLLVRGALAWTNGQVSFGNARVGGSPNLTGVGFPQGSLVAGSPGDFSFFGGAGTFLRSTATFWAGLGQNGSSNVQHGQLDIDGSDSALNVINIDGATLSGLNTIRINTPSNATTLINVSGTSASLQNLGFFLNGQQFDFSGNSRQNVLLNFFEAETIEIAGINLGASVFAPDATVTFNNGQINGSVVASSLIGTGEIHDFLFDGDLPPVPTPGAFAVFALGAAALVRRRR